MPALFHQREESSEEMCISSKPDTIKDIFKRNLSTTESEESRQNEAFEYSPYILITDIMLGYKGPTNRLRFLHAHDQAFTAYNILGKDLFFAPFSIFGDAPLFKDILIGSYFASVSNDNCEYCTCHIVALAEMKDSLTRDKIIFERDRSPSDEALIDVANAIGRFPSDLSDDQLLRMKQYYTAEEAERIAISLSFIGMVNFLSDAFGFEIEEDALRVASPALVTTGWDPWKHTPEGFHMPNRKFELTKDVMEKAMPIMKGIRKYPQQMMKVMDHQLRFLWGVPGSSQKASNFLREKTGYSFPLLRNFTQFRNVTQCITAVLRDQFNPAMTTIGLTTKALCQLIFAGHIDDEYLQEDACQMIKVFAKKEGLDIMDTDEIVDEMLELSKERVPSTKEECQKLLKRITNIPGVASQKNAAILILSRAASSKPTLIQPIVVNEVVNLLSPKEITETLFWLSLQIIFHRMFRFSEIKSKIPLSEWDSSKVISREFVMQTTNNDSGCEQPKQKKQRGWIRQQISNRFKRASERVSV